MERLRSSAGKVFQRVRETKESLLHEPIAKVAIGASFSTAKLVQAAFVPTTIALYKLSEQAPDMDWKAISLLVFAAVTLGSTLAEYYALRTQDACINTNTYLLKRLTHSNLAAIVGSRILAGGAMFFPPTNIVDSVILSYSAVTGNSDLFFLHLAGRSAVSAAYNGFLDLLIARGKIQGAYNKASGAVGYLTEKGRIFTRRTL